MSNTAATASLLAQLDASPTSYHVVEWWRLRLTEAGFSDCSTSDVLSAEQGFICRGGAIIAWKIPQGSLRNGVRIVGAHSDSPGLHIKPQPNKQYANMSLLGVEVYGGPLLNSWLDRDLGIAGHVVLENGSTRLFSSNTAVARISQLAIHLDREVNDKGLVLDKHQHLNALWLTSSKPQHFDQWMAEQVGVDPAQIIASSSQLFDVQQASIIGADESMIASGRIDNQVSCWAAMTALVAQSKTTHPSVVALFDHEEVGSSSATGAAGPLLEHVLERNYPEKHDANHSPLINEGVVIKSNVSQRYATSPTSIVPFTEACGRAKVPVQFFASRNNIACGSTIGPITATRLGIDTIDVGVPQLSMHSAREVCGSQDPIFLRDALTAYFAR